MERKQPSRLRLSLALVMTAIAAIAVILGFCLPLMRPEPVCPMVAGQSTGAVSCNNCHAAQTGPSRWASLGRQPAPTPRTLGSSPCPGAASGSMISANRCASCHAPGRSG